MTSTSNMENLTIRIDPACDALYAHYYLQGAHMLSPHICVKFDAAPFSMFKHTRDYVPITMENKRGEFRKIIIDFGDTRTFRKPLYDWADVYAKVNLTPEDHKVYEKMLPLGPASLGIRVHSKWRIPWVALHNFLKARTRIPSAAEFFSSYKANLRRLTFDDYATPLRSVTDYVHFVSTLWKDDKRANDDRVHFMDAVKRVGGLSFDGGFAPRADGQHFGYDAYIGPPFESLETYREKIGRSFVVFNTPAVKQCHGWKLPEFMAWGKAIISIPPVRMFPAPLVDGEHWLLTDGSVEDIEAKIKRLQDDPGLHARLEKNIRAYFDEYISPDAVMRRIIERAGLEI